MYKTQGCEAERSVDPDDSQSQTSSPGTNRWDRVRRKKAHTRTQREKCDCGHNNDFIYKYSLGNELPRTPIYLYDSKKDLQKSTRQKMVTSFQEHIFMIGQR